MKKDPFKKFLTTASEAAGQLLLRYYRRVHRIEAKENAGIVTEADKAAEALLLKMIHREFPDSSILAEESGEHQGGSGLRWVIDPLDGTSNYAHGVPWYCVSVAVYEGAELRAGAIHQPLLKEMFYAASGRGASLNGKPIRVSATPRLNEALLTTGFYRARGEELSRQMDVFRRLNETARGVRRPGASALELAYVAAGRFDGFWIKGIAPWDVAAGFLLVSEAGGTLTDYRGGRTDSFRKQVVASNGKIHEALVEAVRGIG